MISANSVVIGVPPRITIAKFTAVLTTANSPAAGEAGLAYRAIVAEGLDPAFILALFSHENRYGTDPASMTVKYDLKNPGDCRTSRIGVTNIVSTERGDFVKYDKWATGFRDCARRLIDPAFFYAQEGRVTIGQIIERFAPYSDHNDTAGYIDTVTKLMNQWIGSAGGNKMLDLAKIPLRQSPNFTAGRSGTAPDLIVIHSTEGGYSQSIGWLLNSGSQASAHYIISEDGSDITQLVKATDTAWHTGNWNYNLRAIGIEHSWYSDMRNGAIPDSLVRKGAQLTAALCQKYNIAADRAHVIGHAQVPPPNDHVDPGSHFPWDKFMQYVQEALVDTSTNSTGNQGDPNMITLNGFQLGHGFKTYFEANGGVKVFGLPLSNETLNPRTGLVEQVMERMCLEFDPNEKNPDWQVRGKDIGRFYLTNRGF